MRDSASSLRFLQCTASVVQRSRIAEVVGSTPIVSTRNPQQVANSASPSAVRPLDTLFVSPRLHPRQDYCTKNEVSNVAWLPPPEQVTVIGHAPGVVRVPTIHAQLTMPSWLAVFVSSPLARLGPDF